MHTSTTVALPLRSGASIYFAIHTRAYAHKYFRIFQNEIASRPILIAAWQSDGFSLKQKPTFSRKTVHFHRIEAG